MYEFLNLFPGLHRYRAKPKSHHSLEFFMWSFSRNQKIYSKITNIFKKHNKTSKRRDKFIFIARKKLLKELINVCIYRENTTNFKKKWWSSRKLLNIMFHAPMGRFNWELIVGVEVTHKTCWKCCINNERPTGKKHTNVGWDAVEI